MKKGTAIFLGWLFPFVYCVAGVDAYVPPRALLVSRALIQEVKGQTGALDRLA